MTLTVHNDIEQRSEKWYAARRGIVTASVVGRLITVRKLGALDFDCPACGAEANGPCRSKVKKAGELGAEIKTMHPERVEVASHNKVTVIEPASNEESRGLTMQLAAERITGHTEETRITDPMWRGIFEEPIARDLYSQHYAPVTEVGFMVNTDHGFPIGLSPDGLVGDDGLLEIKSRGQRKQMATVLAETVPAECVAQCQAALLVSGRQWLDYVSFSSAMALYVIRIYPDPRWQKAIVAAVRQCEDNIAEQIARYKETTRGLPVAERTPEYADEIRVA